jgi:ferritin-like metal-binding protein YciE
MKKIVDLKDLEIEQLRKLYYGEIALAKLLPKMKDLANDPRLKQLIADYLIENAGQVMRLEQAFEILYIESTKENCEAMKAMIKEADDIMKRSDDAEVMDAGLITALQHIIHYKIAGYGAVCTYAQTLGMEELAATVHKNLDEEKRTDQQLISLAVIAVNKQAIKKLSYETKGEHQPT